MLYTQSLAQKSFQSLSREKQPSWLLAPSTAVKSPCLNSCKMLLPISRKALPPPKETYLETNPAHTPHKTIRLMRVMPIRLTNRKEFVNPGDTLFTGTLANHYCLCAQQKAIFSDKAEMSFS